MNRNVHILIFTDMVQHLCYKNSTNDGATWNKLTLLAARGCNPTVVCDRRTNNIILQYDVSVHVERFKPGTIFFRSAKPVGIFQRELHLLFGNFCQMLNENKINWNEKGCVRSAPLWIRH